MHKTLGFTLNADFEDEILVGKIYTRLARRKEQANLIKIKPSGCADRVLHELLLFLLFL